MKKWMTPWVLIYFIIGTVSVVSLLVQLLQSADTSKLISMGLVFFLVSILAFGYWCLTYQKRSKIKGLLIYITFFVTFVAGAIITGSIYHERANNEHFNKITKSFANQLISNIKANISSEKILLVMDKTISEYHSGYEKNNYQEVMHNTILELGGQPDFPLSNKVGGANPFAEAGKISMLIAIFCFPIVVLRRKKMEDICWFLILTILIFFLLPAMVGSISGPMTAFNSNAACGTAGSNFLRTVHMYVKEQQIEELEKGLNVLIPKISKPNANYPEMIHESF